MTSITNQLAGQITLGILIYKGVQLADAAKHYLVYIESETGKLKNSFSVKLPDNFQHTRTLYRHFKTDPTKHRPSSEALWRRLKNHHEFPQVNYFVDLTNLLSLKHQLCYGLYDLDKINGSITLTLGSNADSYQGIRKDTIHLTDRIVLKDAQGPFGNPSSDSARTATSDQSQNILQVIFFPPQALDADEAITDSAKLFQQFFAIENCYQTKIGDNQCHQL